MKKEVIVMHRVLTLGYSSGVICRRVNRVANNPVSVVHVQSPRPRKHLAPGCATVTLEPLSVLQESKGGETMTKIVLIHPPVSLTDLYGDLAGAGDELAPQGLFFSRSCQETRLYPCDY